MNVLLVNCSPVRNGATAEIIKIVHSFLDKEHDIRSICIDDYDIKFCKGCRSCHKTAKCVQNDDVISAGKKGYSIALRTGPNMKECNRIIESIEHFYGHLEIVPSGSLGLCSIEYKEALEDRKDEIHAFCSKISSAMIN